MVKGRIAVPGCSIAIDVMSGYKSPCTRIRAALRVLENYPDLNIFLIGDHKFITDYLSTISTDRSRIGVKHAEKAIGMDEKPSAALRSKEGSSMWVALELVANGSADACVSSGNTGALMALARFSLKTFDGIDRPAIAGTIPCAGGNFLLLDMGANVDCTAAHLYQFAVMGSVLDSLVGAKASPRIGLLNVGTEDIKGNEQVRLASSLLKEDERLNYIGYIEGNDVFYGGTDVVVCDGFVGNIALKTAEGVVSLIRDRMVASLQQTLWRRFLSLLIAPALRNIYKFTDPVVYNGASLLGLRHTVVKSHSDAGEEGFFQAVVGAIREVQSDIPTKLAEEVESMLNS